MDLHIKHEDQERFLRVLAIIEADLVYARKRTQSIIDAVRWLETAGYAAELCGSTTDEKWLVTHPNGSQLVMDYWWIRMTAEDIEKKFNKESGVPQ